MSDLLGVYGVVAVVLAFIGGLLYSDPYRPRYRRRLGARVLLAAPVWPVAVPLAAVAFLVVMVPRVVRDAFRKD